MAFAHFHTAHRAPARGGSSCACPKPRWFSPFTLQNARLQQRLGPACQAESAAGGMRRLEQPLQRTEATIQSSLDSLDSLLGLDIEEAASAGASELPQAAAIAMPQQGQEEQQQQQQEQQQQQQQWPDEASFELWLLELADDKLDELLAEATKEFFLPFLPKAAGRDIYEQQLKSDIKLALAISVALGIAAGVAFTSWWLPQQLEHSLWLQRWLLDKYNSQL